MLRHDVDEGADEYRSFEAGSPNLLALGQQSDMSDLVIRSDYEIRNWKRWEPQDKDKEGSGEQEQ